MSFAVENSVRAAVNNFYCPFSRSIEGKNFNTEENRKK